MFLVGFLLFSFFAGGLGWAQQQPLPEPKALHASSSQTLQNPPFSGEGHLQCDNDGNLFFGLVDRRSSHPPNEVVRLSPKDALPVVYQFPSRFGDSSRIAIEDFYVGRLGKVWLLSMNREGESAVFEFEGDGEMLSRTSLDAPAYLAAERFAVSSDGVTLVAGYFGKGAAAKSLWGKRYMALFDASGRLRKELGGEAGKDIDLKAGPPSFADGAVTPGPDGNFYFLRSNDVLVISEYGEILRTILFQKPEANLMPDWLVLSDGLMSLEFVKVDKNNHINSEFLVLDSVTGVPYGLYTASDLGFPVGFSRKEGYTFLQFDEGKAKILVAPLR